jgi:hypothetical protein
MIKNVCRSACEVAVILFRCEINFNFLSIFSKNTQTSNFMKIRSVGAELFHAYRQTDGQDKAKSRVVKFFKRASHE